MKYLYETVDDADLYRIPADGKRMGHRPVKHLLHAGESRCKEERPKSNKETDRDTKRR